VRSRRSESMLVQRDDIGITMSIVTTEGIQRGYPGLSCFLLRRVRGRGDSL
jgi:hypothetical protein